MMAWEERRGDRGQGTRRRGPRECEGGGFPPTREEGWSGIGLPLGLKRPGGSILYVTGASVSRLCLSRGVKDCHSLPRSLPHRQMLFTHRRVRTPIRHPLTPKKTIKPQSLWPRTSLHFLEKENGEESVRKSESFNLKKRPREIVFGPTAVPKVGGTRPTTPLSGVTDLEQKPDPDGVAPSCLPSCPPITLIS